MPNIYINLYKIAKKDIPIQPIITAIESYNTHSISVSQEDLKNLTKCLYSSWIEKAIALANQNSLLDNEDLFFYYRNRMLIDKSLGTNPKEGAFSSKKLCRIFHGDFHSLPEDLSEKTVFIQYISDRYLSLLSEKKSISLIIETIKTDRGNTLFPGLNISSTHLQTAAEKYASSMAAKIVEIKNPPQLRQTLSESPHTLYPIRKQKRADSLTLIKQELVDNSEIANLLRDFTI